MINNLYSIGYGNRKIENFILLLQKFNIKILIDIRSVPYSKFRPAFNQIPFKKALAENQIDYIFKGKELGGKPTDESLYTNGMIDYDKLRQASFYLKGLNELQEILKSEKNVALMCAELDFKTCHRWNLIGVDLSKKDTLMNHINKVGNIENYSQLL